MKFLMLLVAWFGIDIDAAWLAARTEPYILDQYNATYSLKQDIVSTGVPFVVGNTGIVLDGEGHTVTYGNSEPLAVENGGFEEGLNGYDLTRCSKAFIAPARRGMWGANMLSVPDFNEVQTIVTNPIAIPAIGKEYAATVTPKGSQGTICRLFVIDTVTNAVLAWDNADSVSSGFGAVALFSPTTKNPVKLQIDLIPPTDKIAKVDLDYVTITSSRNYGIIASKTTTNLPAHLKTAAIGAALRKGGNITVKNLKLVQGKSKNYGGSAINCQATKGVTLENVTTEVNGMDTLNVDNTFGGDIRIVNCLFNSTIDNISNRKRVFGMVNCTSCTNNIAILNNTLLNCPQSGVVVANNTEGTVLVDGNIIKPNGIISNAYGIMTSGVTSFTIANNTITAECGRGISLDSWDSANSINGLIVNNTIDVRVKPNLEYDEKFMVAAAMRWRTYQGSHKNVRIHGNKFISRTTDGEGLNATSLRLTYTNDNGQMTDCGNIIENNLFQSIVETTDKNYRAAAVALAGVGPDTGLIFRNNIFESNDVSLKLGDDGGEYRGNNSDLFFNLNSFSKLEDARRSYTAILIGDNNQGCSNVNFHNNQYINGATEVITFMGQGLKDVTFTTAKNYKQLTTDHRKIEVTP